MKRKSKISSWRNKLDDAGVQFLDAYRRSKQEHLDEEKRSGGQNWLERLISVAKKSGPNETDDPREMLMREMAADAEMPPVLELQKFIYDVLEASRSAERESISFLLAIAVGFAGDTFLDARKRHFGTRGLNDREFFWVLGTTLEAIGHPFKTGNKTYPTKGRVNAELVSLIRRIRKHEKQSLSYRELKEALEYVLVHVGTEEQLRLFVFRARKRGWL